MKKLAFMLVLLASCAIASPMHLVVNGNDPWISRWLKFQCSLIRKTKGVAHVAYSRHFVYAGIAVYEAMVPGNKEYHSLAGQLNGLGSLPKPEAKSYQYELAGNAAFAESLRQFYPSLIYSIDSMEASNSKSLRENLSAQEIDRSVAFGKAIAQAVVKWSADDGSSKTYPAFTQVAGEGKWVPTPPAYAQGAVPYWCESRSMLSDKRHEASMLNQFSREKGQPFYAMVKEVYDVSRSLTEEQKAIAWFWDDSPNGKYVSVFGHWASILAQLAIEKDLSAMVTIEALTKMSISQYEASLACWKEKYRHSLLRPVTYIQSYIDPQWQPLIETPPHPEFPAAHATLSGAAATALTEIFGTSVQFSDHTYDDLQMKPRTFASIDAAAREAGISRLYGGIHYRPSIEAGLELGKKSASTVLQRVKFK